MLNSLLRKVTARKPSNLVKKIIQHIFSYEFCKICKNTCFEKNLRKAASEVTLGSDCLGLSF